MGVPPPAAAAAAEVRNLCARDLYRTLRSSLQSLPRNRGRCPRSFPAHADNILLLRTPLEFYNSILSAVGTAKERITLCSLYFGTGAKEAALVQGLKQQLTRYPHLQLQIVVDHSRGQRGSHNSCTVLAPLVARFPSQCNVSLFQMPQLRGPASSRIPSPLNETVAVSHLKCCVFDRDLIMTGANLSNDYFTDRQDRYMSVKDNDISNLYHEMVMTLAGASVQVQADGSAVRQPGSNVGNAVLRAKLETLFLEDVPSSGVEDGSSGEDLPTSAVEEGKSPPAEEGEDVSNAEGVGMPSSSRAGTGPEASSSREGGGREANVWLLPSLQFAPLGIRWDETTTLALLRSLQQQQQQQQQRGRGLLQRVALSSAYMNFPARFLSPLVAPLQESGAIQRSATILSSGPASHGFAGAQGVKAIVPKLYESLMNQTTKKEALHVMLYERAGWTFHAKGIWGWQDENGDGGSGAAPQAPSHSGPVVSMVGSSNLGNRSVDRDLESNIYLITTSEQLQASLQSEWEGLLEHATEYRQEPQQQQEQQQEQQQPTDGRGRPGLVVRGLAHLLKGLL